MRGGMLRNEGMHGRKRVLQRTLPRHEGGRAQLRLVRSQVRDDERNAVVRGGRVQVELCGRLHSLRAPRSEHWMRGEHRARCDEVWLVHEQLHDRRSTRERNVHGRPVRVRGVSGLLLQRGHESRQRLRGVVRWEDRALLPVGAAMQARLQLQRRLGQVQLTRLPRSTQRKLAMRLSMVRTVSAVS